MHEVYLRLVDQERPIWRNRAQFLAIASEMMRRILVDGARARKMAKRSGGLTRVTLAEDAARREKETARLRKRYKGIFTELGATEITGLNATTRMQANDEHAARLVRDASGIFLTGGNQLRLSSLIAGTRMADAIMARFMAGEAGDDHGWGFFDLDHSAL